MIIQIIGTSGSGKTTVVRHVLSQMTSIVPSFISGRRTPVGYVGQLVSQSQPIFVVGNYDIVFGGCDNLRNLDRVYHLIIDAVDRHHSVLFEGLVVMNHTRGPTLARRVGVHNMKMIHLDVSLDECMKRVRKRRIAAGEDPQFNPHNTKKLYVRANNYARKMQLLGVEVRRCPTERAQTMVIEMLTGKFS